MCIRGVMSSRGAMSSRSALVLALTVAAAASGCSSASTAETVTSPSSSGPAVVKGKKLADNAHAALAASRTFVLTNDSRVSNQKSVTKVVAKGPRLMDADATVDASGNKIRLISLSSGQVQYVKSDALMVPAWMKVNQAGTDTVSRRLMANVRNLTSPISPWASFTASEQVDFTEVGDATMNGVKVRHYRGVASPQVVASATPEESRAMVISVLAGHDTPVDLYINEKHRPIKQVLTMTMAGKQQTFTNLWSGFGNKITVTAPK